MALRTRGRQFCSIMCFISIAGMMDRTNSKSVRMLSSKHRKCCTADEHWRCPGFIYNLPSRQSAVRPVGVLSSFKNLWGNWKKKKSALTSGRFPRGPPLLIYLASNQITAEVPCVSQERTAFNCLSSSEEKWEGKVNWTIIYCQRGRRRRRKRGVKEKSEWAGGDRGSDGWAGGPTSCWRGLGVLRHVSPITDKVSMLKHNYK